MIYKQATKMYEVMFFDMQKYVYSESVFNTIYIEIKRKSLKNSISDEKLN